MTLAMREKRCAEMAPKLTGSCDCSLLRQQGQGAAKKAAKKGAKK